MTLHKRHAYTEQKMYWCIQQKSQKNPPPAPNDNFVQLAPTKNCETEELNQKGRPESNGTRSGNTFYEVSENKTVWTVSRRVIKTTSLPLSKWLKTNLKKNTSTSGYSDLLILTGGLKPPAKNATTGQNKNSSLPKNSHQAKLQTKRRTRSILFSTETTLTSAHSHDTKTFTSLTFTTKNWILSALNELRTSKKWSRIGFSTTPLVKKFTSVAFFGESRLLEQLFKPAISTVWLASPWNADCALPKTFPSNIWPTFESFWKPHLDATSHTWWKIQPNRNDLLRNGFTYHVPWTPLLPFFAWSKPSALENVPLLNLRSQRQASTPSNPSTQSTKCGALNRLRVHHIVVVANMIANVNQTKSTITRVPKKDYRSNTFVATKSTVSIKSKTLMLKPEGETKDCRRQDTLKTSIHKTNHWNCTQNDSRHPWHWLTHKPTKRSPLKNSQKIFWFWNISKWPLFLKLSRNLDGNWRDLKCNKRFELVTTPILSLDVNPQDVLDKLTKKPNISKT